MIPPLVNTFIGFFKDTSLVLIIGIFDLLTAGKTAIVEPAWQGFGIEVYVFVGADLLRVLLRHVEVQPGPRGRPQQATAPLTASAPAGDRASQHDLGHENHERSHRDGRPDRLRRPHRRPAGDRARQGQQVVRRAARAARRDLQVALGERVVVCGPSGSGKSTMIRCINRLETHQEGKILVDGIELTDDLRALDAIRREVGMVFQSFNLFPHLTILENCTLAPIWVRKMPKKEAEELAMEYLTRVRIPEQATKYPGQLSGGQQQRVAIARALCMKPKIMLFDEPTSRARPRDDQGGARHHGRRWPTTGMTMIVRDARDGLRPPGRRPRGVHPLLRLGSGQDFRLTFPAGNRAQALLLMPEPEIPRFILGDAPNIIMCKPLSGGKRTE